MTKENNSSSLEKRDLAIIRIQNTMKKMDNELDSVYKRIKKEDQGNKEYEGIVKEEEQIKKKQIKKLKELYNYINKNSNKKEREKVIEEDKNDILNEINKIEKVLRK